MFHSCCAFPKPQTGSVFYEDPTLYACLAFQPWVEGHTVVVLKRHAEDLGDLTDEELLHLMRIAVKIQTALKQIYGAVKVYFIFFNEAGHVHLHFYPRKEEDPKGFALFVRLPGELKDISKVPALRKMMRCQE